MQEKLHELRLEMSAGQKKTANHQLMQTTQFQTDFRKCQQGMLSMEERLNKLVLEKIEERVALSWGGIALVSS